VPRLSGAAVDPGTVRDQQTDAELTRRRRESPSETTRAGTIENGDHRSGAGAAESRRPSVANETSELDEE